MTLEHVTNTCKNLGKLLVVDLMQIGVIFSISEEQ